MWGRDLIGVAIAEIRRDVSSAQAHDPAAQGVRAVEILLAWPGVQALLAHRIAHRLLLAGVPLLPRLIALVARWGTGVEIHPAAQIGPGLFIDHGMGVVIGETASIGADVTLYQGVTLGGIGFATGKRHPTVADNVTIGAGAKLLGPITVGAGAKIGANTVVIHDVPSNTTVVGNPGHPVRVEGRRPQGPDADWVHLPDPVADAIKALARRIRDLEAEVQPAKHGVGHLEPGPDDVFPGDGPEAPVDNGSAAIDPDPVAYPARSGIGPNPAGG